MRHFRRTTGIGLFAAIVALAVDQLSKVLVVVSAGNLSAHPEPHRSSGLWVGLRWRAWQRHRPAASRRGHGFSRFLRKHLALAGLQSRGYLHLLRCRGASSCRSARSASRAGAVLSLAVGRRPVQTEARRSCRKAYLCVRARVGRPSRPGHRFSSSLWFLSSCRAYSPDS